jgi:hypothetical protein
MEASDLSLCLSSSCFFALLYHTTTLLVYAQISTPAATSCVVTFYFCWSLAPVGFLDAGKKIDTLKWRHGSRHVCIA